MGQLVAYHGGRFLLFAGTEALRGTGPGTVGDGVACHSGFKVLKLVRISMFTFHFLFSFM